jgi:hypothetical protein
MHRLQIPKTHSLTVLASLSLAMIANCNPNLPDDGKSTLVLEQEVSLAAGQSMKLSLNL